MRRAMPSVHCKAVPNTRAEGAAAAQVLVTRPQPRDARHRSVHPRRGRSNIGSSRGALGSQLDENIREIVKLIRGNFAVPMLGALAILW